MQDNFSENEVEEFTIEALELLDEAETALLTLDKGGDFAANFNAIFRAFHSVKGASGMLGLTELQAHMHKIENHFQSCKSENTLSRARVSYFLAAIDTAKSILDNQSVSFEYELPFNEAPVSVSNQKQIESKLASKNEKLELPIIYIIDDEEDIVEILTTMIKMAGYDARGFLNPGVALEHITKDKPHAIFTDMSMPQMSGLDVLRGAHKIDADLPVVFVSGYLTKEVMIESMSYGVFGAIEKPFKETQIINMCHNAARRYELVTLLNRSLNFILYQFTDLDEYLKQKGQEDIREIMNKELKKLLEARRLLKQGKLSN